MVGYRFGRISAITFNVTKWRNLVSSYSQELRKFYYVQLRICFDCKKKPSRYKTVFMNGTLQITQFGAKVLQRYEPEIDSQDLQSCVKVCRFLWALYLKIPQNLTSKKRCDQNYKDARDTAFIKSATTAANADKKKTYLAKAKISGEVKFLNSRTL